MARESIIKLDTVSKSYDDVLAVNTLSLDIYQGETLVLLGHSGCGKTSTLRLIAGLEQPNSGAIWMNGQSVASDSTWIPPEKRNVGMVFQDYALLPHMTVEENISFALQGWRKDQQRARIATMLDLVGMSDTEKRYPHQLSGGQQQRIALARALAPEPTILLLDEPFSNLDAARRKSMREEVSNIIRTVGATALFVTHDQEEAMQMGDRIAVMQAGSILQIGRPDDLYHMPASRAVGEFLGEANWIDGIASHDTVETPLGQLHLTQPLSGNVTVMIRPESVQLIPDETSDASVKSVRFYGHYKLIDIQLANDVTITARVWSDNRLKPDDRVRIKIEKSVVAFT